MKKVHNLFELLKYKIAISREIIIGGDLHMVDVYIALIIRGRRTLDMIPSRIREDVRVELEALGLDEKGRPVDFN